MRKNYEVTLERTRIDTVTIQVEGASSEEEARERALLAASFQSPPRKEGDPLPHVYLGPAPVFRYEGEPEILSLEEYPAPQK